MDYELVVIGGGAGGLGAARAGVRAGRRTLLVQDGAPGGDCTFTGCVPSKTLLARAARGDQFTAAMAAVGDAVARIAATEDATALRSEGIDVLDGRARFVSRNEISVDGRVIGADRFVIATGSTPLVPPIDGLAGVDALTTDDLWDLKEPPRSLIVLGGGPSGCELAQAFAQLGVPVTLVDAADRLLDGEEPEAGVAARQALEGHGVTVALGAAATAARRTDAGLVRIERRNAAAVEAERVLVALGRQPTTQGLDPEAAGVELDEGGHVRTDDYLRTTAGHIYAAGDVTGRLLLTHAADEMARIAVANAFPRLRLRRFRAERIPRVTYTTPEVAALGWTEAEAAERDPKARVAWLPFAEVDRGTTEGRTDGFIKVICGSRALLGTVAGGRVVGATIVADRAGEIIAPFVLARRSGLFPAQLAVTTQAYPSWSVAVQQTMAQFFTEWGGRRARPARPEGAPPA